MTAISDKLDRMVITAISPDSGIRAELRNRSHIKVFFRPRRYEHYDKAQLAVQIQSVLEQLWKGRRAGVQKIIGSTGNPHWDARHRRYRSELDSEHFLGGSSRDGIAVASKGMKEFRVRISDYAFGLYEKEFTKKLEDSISLLQLHQKQKELELKNKHFDLGLPTNPNFAEATF